MSKYPRFMKAIADVINSDEEKRYNEETLKLIQGVLENPQGDTTMLDFSEKSVDKIFAKIENGVIAVYLLDAKNERFWISYRIFIEGKNCYVEEVTVVGFTTENNADNKDDESAGNMEDINS